MRVGGERLDEVPAPSGRPPGDPGSGESGLVPGDAVALGAVVSGVRAEVAVDK